MHRCASTSTSTKAQHKTWKKRQLHLYVSRASAMFFDRMCPPPLHSPTSTPPPQSNPFKKQPTVCSLFSVFCLVGSAHASSPTRTKQRQYEVLQNFLSLQQVATCLAAATTLARKRSRDRRQPRLRASVVADLATLIGCAGPRGWAAGAPSSVFEFDCQKL